MDTKKIDIKDKIESLIIKDVRNKRFTLIGMGSELNRIADKKSNEYEQLKWKYDKLESTIKKEISYLDGTYRAQNLIKAASKAKDERNEALTRKRTESTKLDEKLKTLEFKREEEIQKIKELRGKINRINLLSGDEETTKLEDKEYDEVLQEAEVWNLQKEMMKRSLNLRTINARIGMAKIRKVNQDAKDIENAKKVIDKYNEKITKYKEKMDKENQKRPKSISEEFLREHDWILGAVTIDKNKKLEEVIEKIDEENNQRREMQQEKYSTEAQQENSKLPYKELNDKKRNELIEYSEEMTTFKQLTEFLKIKAARAAGKVVGYAILGARKIKTKIESIINELKSNKEKAKPEQMEKKQIQAGEVTKLETPKQLEEVSKSVEKPDVANEQKPAVKVKVKKVEKSNVKYEEKTRTPVKVTPIRARVAVDNNVKKAIEAVPTIKKEEPNRTEKEIDINTFE